MRKVLCLLLSLALLLFGWFAARFVIAGLENYLAAAAGVLACALMMVVSPFLHGTLRLMLPVMLAGGVMYLIFWKLTDKDIIGTIALLITYVACLAVVALSMAEEHS